MPAELPRAKQAVYLLRGRHGFYATSAKIGPEYNQGSKYCIGTVRALDDKGTSKRRARGHVYDVYIIQKITNRPISQTRQGYLQVRVSGL